MTSDRIRRAAELLREEAERLRDSHATCYDDGGVLWDLGDSDGDSPEIEHDEMLSLADELEEMAG